MKTQNSKSQYRGVVLCTNGNTVNINIPSEMIEETRQFWEKLDFVAILWIEDLDGPGYDWNNNAKLWQRRLF